jgi:c-di-GMP-binding flagellar brake protein YcgR
MKNCANIIFVQGEIKREHPRFAHEAAVVLYVDGTHIRGRSNNLSKGGMCVVVEAPIVIGLDVELDLSLIFEAQGESEPLRLNARVAWCTGVDAGFQLGLSFRGLDVARARYLQMFLKYMNAAPKEPVAVDEDVFEAARSRAKF